jgi:hypothetical protein
MNCGEPLIAAIGVAAGAILGSLAAIIKADAARKRADAELVKAKAEAEKRAEEVVKKLDLRAPPRLSPVKKTPGTRATAGSLEYGLLAREVLSSTELVDEWLAGRLDDES